MLKERKEHIFDVAVVIPGDLIMVKDNHGMKKLSHAYTLYSIVTVTPESLRVVNIDQYDPYDTQTLCITPKDLHRNHTVHIPRETVFTTFVAADALIEDDLFEEDYDDSEDLVDDGAFMPIDGEG